MTLVDLMLSSTTVDISPQLLILLAIILLCVGLGAKGLAEKDITPSHLRRPPGPYGVPVLGNLLQLGREPHKTLTAYRKTYGNVYQLTLGSRPTVVLNGYDTVRKALVKQADDFAGRPDFYSFNFIANGKSMGFGDLSPRWRMHRKIAQNALGMFANKKQNPIEDNILDEAKLLVSNLVALGSSSDGTTVPVDPHNEVYLSVGNIICAMCFGERYQRDDPDFLHLVKMNDEFMRFAGAGNPVDIMPWMRHFTKGSFKRFIGILNTMDNFCLKKRQEHLDTYIPGELRDITDALIRIVQETPEEEKAAVGLTDEHILTTVQEMIGAGFDTISTTIMWAILFMAAHQDFQQKVQKEIDQVIGKGRFPSADDIQSLPFTEACIIETMRHSCIFPFALPHATTCDTSLDGIYIPDKTLIFVNLWSVNHDENVFPEPEKFNPYRFLKPDGSVVDKLSFFPYGCGKRKCPGELLARLEVFMFFTTLLQRCTFKPVDGDTIKLNSKYGLTLKPNDYKVIVSQRGLD
ncbi:cytochrome P450 1A1-like [Lineus longissimus]|uniref:cytochrome P450 1A1-like n=1 Tax=Lineus longissimus TaxID=88925 RepID=UPI00315DD04D